MKKLFLALVLIGASLVFFETTAEAGECRFDTACDVARIQANLPEYRGPRKPTTQTMVCVHALAYEPTELVLANGDQPYGAPVAGHVITKWRVQTSQWKPWPRDRRYVYREICFPKALLHEGNDPKQKLRDAVTLCNGVELNQPLRNRSVWRTKDGVPQYIAKVRRVGLADPSCLLGDGLCAEYGL